eukprot:4796107-Pyramimonas_sp.AAC.1
MEAKYSEMAEEYGRVREEESGSSDAAAPDRVAAQARAPEGRRVGERRRRSRDPGPPRHFVWRTPGR